MSDPRFLPRRRRRLLLTTLFLGGFLIGARLVELQVVRHEFLAARAQNQRRDVEEIPGPRANIYDRREQLLATSVPVEVLAIEPRKIAPVVLSALESAAGTEHGRLTRQADARWVIVRRDCDERVRAAVDRLVETGVLPKDAVWWGPGYRRSYPLGPRAAHVLGFVTLDGETAEGVERFYDRMLRSPGKEVSLAVDAHQKRIDLTELDPPAEGDSLMLTIDARIQAVLEDALLDALEQNGARLAKGVVLDPRSGEVLALAVAPAFDPNHFNEYASERHRNALIEEQFEPGSVMKPFTAVALAESGEVRSSDAVYCEMGTWRAARGRTLRDVAPHGMLTLPEVIQVSSNIGIVKFARRLSPERLYRSLSGLGFGQKTGVDLPAESPGRLHSPGSWHEWDRDSIAFGHALTVTPLQLASAAATIANGGVRVRPRVGRAFGSPGAWQPYAQTTAEVVMSRETAAQVTAWMRRVVEEQRATGHRAAIPGYTVAGKTGTAEKNTGQGYDKGKNIASFLGFAPATAPAAVVVISIDEPHREGRTGGVVAAPVFARVMGETLRLLRVPPDRPDDPVLLAAKEQLHAAAAAAEMADDGVAESAPTAVLDDLGRDAATAVAVAPAVVAAPAPGRHPSPPVAARPARARRP